MPVYDRICANGHEQIDCLEPITFRDPVCHCGASTKRAWLTGSASVRDDLIPGGVLITNGLCWPDGSPRRFDSKLEMQRAAKAAGLENTVRHAPTRGSDKSSHTVRWVSSPWWMSETDDARAVRIAERERDDAAHLGMTVVEFRAHMAAPLESRLHHPEDPVWAAIARTCSALKLVGHDA